MRLDTTAIDLDRFDRPAAPIRATRQRPTSFPAPGSGDGRRGGSLGAGAAPISRECAVTLPPSSGGVTAVKSRDPDGHPLGFLQFPPGANPGWTGSGIQGVDHSAISVADIVASRRFYVGHGLAEGPTTLNQGPAQVSLDGVDRVVADVVPMKPSATPMHLELLGYRTPRGRPHGALAANDTAATRIVWRADREALIRDPDGQLHQLTR